MKFVYGDLIVFVRRVARGKYLVKLTDVAGEVVAQDNVYGSMADVKYFVKTRFNKYGKLEPMFKFAGKRIVSR